ncbi:MAG TPA: peroxiredoxin [Hyphomonadaceae bacterium]|nr:peroxiredoxin [Hyphomonadaceae bacterium]
MTHPLEAGDKAPDFVLPATKGGKATLEEYAGKTLILFFYPKDDTEVCTREAVAFSEAQSKFTRKGAALLGVSRDSLEDHKAFARKYKLKVRLGSDVDGVACNAWGVWQEKQLYGNKFMGIVRSTFVVGPDGTILRVWRNVRVPGHVDAVLQFLADRR